MARGVRTPWCVAGLLALTLCAYGPVRGNGFVNLDDDQYVTENVMVRRGLTGEGLRWAFGAIHAANWHPLTWLSHMTDVSLFGVHPGPHHLVSVGWHGLNALLLYVLAWRLLGDRRPAFWMAALFAVHPVHVESVAWVSERKDVLSTALGLLTLLAYQQYQRDRGRPRAWCWYASALAAFAAGLMAKPMLVTLPLLMLLLAWASRVENQYPKGNGVLIRWPLVSVIPFLLLSAASAWITVVAQQAGGALQPLTRVPLDLRLANAAVSLVAYLRLWAWPQGLAVFYPYRQSVPLWQWIGALGVLVTITAVILRVARRKPVMALGWGWFLVTLLPVIGLVQVGNQAMADRYLYIPGMGLLLMTVPALVRAAGEARGALVLTVGLWCLIALSVVVTRAQVRHWADSESLYRHALAVTTENWMAHHNLGVALDEAGRPAEAERHLREALRILPDYADGHYNLGNVLVRLGRYAEADAAYAASLRLRPNHADALTNYGALLFGLGRLQESLPLLNQAVALAPTMAEAHNNLGNVLGALGLQAEALAHFERALALQPDYPDAQNNLAVVLAEIGRLTEAEAQYRKLLRAAPDYLDAYNNLGITLQRLGRREEALALFDHVLRVQPGHEQARRNREQLLDSPAP